jgi:signal transduction histidine kinase
MARLASAFNEMIARLSRGFLRIRRFSANASHELRTPLTTIRGTAEVALMGERSGEQYRQALESIVQEAERMAAIVDNLLLLARADAGQVDMKRERVALQDIVVSVYEQAEAEAHARGVSLDIAELQEVSVLGDALWIRQIAANLLSNAVKFTPSGGRVTLNLERRGDDARLSVADTGPGIAPEHLDRIFERFYRVKHDTGGAGLGLHIAAWVATELGGRIDVESEPGRGSTFTLVLPAA